VTPLSSFKVTQNKGRRIRHRNMQIKTFKVSRILANSDKMLSNCPRFGENNIGVF